MNATAAILHSATLNAWTALATVGRWWLNEIRDTGAAVSRRFRPSRNLSFYLELNRGEVNLRSDDEQQYPSKAGPLSQDDSLPPLTELFLEAAPREACVSIVLAPENVLICTLRLPPLSARDLGAAVELQLERELPIDRAEVSVAWKVDGPSNENATTVSVAIARTAYLGRLQQQVESWGWHLTSIGVADDSGDHKINLLPKKQRSFDLAVGPRERRLVLLFFMLLAVYELTAGVQWWAERRSLTPALNQARTHLSAFEKQRRALSAESQPILALRSIAQAPSVGQMLEALTSSVPSDTWLYQTEMETSKDHGTSIKLSGFTPSATTLVDLLEKDPHFDHVELVRASSGATNGAEQMEVRASWTMATPPPGGKL